MKWRFSVRALFIPLSIFLLLTQVNPSLAQEDNWDPCGSNDVCRQLLDQGRKAYEKGLHYKAGRYFHRAVNISPVSMAAEWFKMKRELSKTTVDTDEERLIPQPPAVTIRKEEGQAKEPGIIIVDDEGC